MLLVATCVGPSEIEGVGVYAEHFIPEGSRIWMFDPRIDRIYSREELRRAPKSFRDFVDRYGYFDRTLNGIVVEGDHGRFMNHSLTPNVEFHRDGDGYAICDIAAGEELVCNYQDFMDDPVILPSRFEALGKQLSHGVLRSMRQRYPDRSDIRS